MDLLRPRWNPTVNSTAPSVASLPASVAEPFRTSIAVASDAWCALRSVPDSARSCSSARCPRPSHRPMDIDILVVSSGFPHGLVERRRPLLAAWSETCARYGVPAVEWNLVTKTPAEARHHSPLYLDIVDGILLLDRGRFFETVLDAMRARMRELGSRRVFLHDGSWYWHLEARLPVRRGGRDMTSARMGRLYTNIDEAASRVELVRLAVERELRATVVREAQECVERFLKGALRLLAVEPARTHDIAELLLREAARFPEWFRAGRPPRHDLDEDGRRRALGTTPSSGRTCSGCATSTRRATRRNLSRIEPLAGGHSN